jgi:putative DNA primase/helicase
MVDEQRAASKDAPVVEDETYPADCCEPAVEQWLTWKRTTDDRKVPRAPYTNPGQPDQYVNAQNADVWTDFETAHTWAQKLNGHQLAFTIRDRDKHPGEEFVLIDYDDARDPKTGKLHPTVRDHLTIAGSYADVSPSGTGVHILCRGELPDGVKTLTDTLPPNEMFPEATIEVYDSARYVAMSGSHLITTPTDIRPNQAFLDQLVDEYATVVEGTPDTLLEKPTKSKEELAAIDTTAEIEDIFDAIKQTRPSDIQLHSPVTEERNDGSKSLDPEWTRSESGTRLAQVEAGWIYREGMIGLDALQVVALEERIITDVRSYPSGNAFWDAVDALRNRGASIPTYQATNAADNTDVDSPAEASSSMAATGDVELTLEVRLLRERVAEQEAIIEEREATIANQRDRIAALESEVVELRDKLTQREQDEEQGSSHHPRPWKQLKTWFTGW